MSISKINSSQVFLEILKKNKIILIISTLILYAFSFYYNNIYYAKFDINYFEYVSIDELLIISIVFFMKLFLYTIAIETILFFIINKILFAKKDSKKINQNQNKDGQLYLFCRRTLWIDYIIGFAYPLIHWNGYISLIFLFIATIKFSIIAYNKEIILFLEVFGLSAFSLGEYSDLNQFSVIHGKTYDTTQEFILNNDTITTGDKIHNFGVIGQTQSTVFLYDRRNKESIIIGKDEIKKIIIIKSSPLPFKEWIKYTVLNYTSEIN